MLLDPWLRWSSFTTRSGLPTAFHGFATALRDAGHTTHSPDLYAGRTFQTIEDGMTKASGGERLYAPRLTPNVSQKSEIPKTVGRPSALEGRSGQEEALLGESGKSRPERDSGEVVTHSVLLSIAWLVWINGESCPRTRRSFTNRFPYAQSTDETEATHQPIRACASGCRGRELTWFCHDENGSASGVS
jgi:hypothetical protein